MPILYLIQRFVENCVSTLIYHRESRTMTARVANGSISAVAIKEYALVKEIVDTALHSRLIPESGSWSA
jgi:hypothetical protein